MKSGLVFIALSVLIFACHSEQQSDNNSIPGVQKDSATSTTKENVVPNKEVAFINFPIPVLDSIFPFYETSGAIENSPSDKYFNPSDSGIFVFYTLFAPRSSTKSKGGSMQENIGTIITHTYRKDKYGWAPTDKDQTFIGLHVNTPAIKVGNSIQVGKTIDELTNELGTPIYIKDSTYIFLGKNKIVGCFNAKNDRVESFSYVRYNLADNIFTIDSASRRAIITEKLKSEG